MISLSIRQGLHQRHIQMIALAGAIGSELTRSVFFSFSPLLHPTNQTWVLTHLLPAGLFLGSGKAIAQAGPLGAFMGYT